MILAGDVGGTKTALALFTEGPADLTPLREAALPSRQFLTLERAIESFLGGGPHGEITAACFGVAGPVVGGRCRTTNLPWEIDETRLAGAIPARQVKLLNDLEAMGHGVLGLPPSALAALQVGERRNGNMVLIAAGTGLGEAILVWDGSRHAVIASEGGHVEFGPRTDLDIDLLRFLRAEVGHVSYERVVSGPGFFNTYRFLRERSGVPEPRWLAEAIAGGDPGAVLSQAGLAGEDPVCVQALDLFVSLYGAEAGNLALKALAVGGVFVGGGIAPKIRSKLADGTFTTAFRDKGRYAALMASIPVWLVLEPRAALLGAARVARELT